jgi:hypothetical protein
MTMIESRENLLELRSPISEIVGKTILVRVECRLFEEWAELYDDGETFAAGVVAEISHELQHLRMIDKKNCLICRALTFEQLVIRDGARQAAAGVRS